MSNAIQKYKVVYTITEKSHGLIYVNATSKEDADIRFRDLHRKIQKEHIFATCGGELDTSYGGFIEQEDPPSFYKGKVA